MVRVSAFVTCAGLALSASAHAQDAVRVAAQSATKIEALRVDGSVVFGKTVSLSGASRRGACAATVAFDQLSWLEQCGNGELYPQSGVMQSAVEDVVPVSGTQGVVITEFNLAADRLLCDGGAGTTAEEFQLLVLLWEVVDNTADLDGTDGFAAPPLGLVTPMELVDSDGDTFIDGLNGGIVLTYADTDTDGDGINDALLSSGSEGYRHFFATGLDTLGVPMPTGIDDNGDGKPDGGIQVMMTRGLGDDGQGPLFGGFYPATNSRMHFGATAEDDVSGCLAQNGLGQGSSNGTLWAEGMSECGGGSGWSDGSLSPATDELYDPLVDIRDLSGQLAPPNPSSFGIAMRIGARVVVPVNDCCDANGDGNCTSTDFSAWINAFNNNLPQCDVNQDGNCDATDFSAWIGAFNASTAGTPIICAFGC